MTGAFRRPRIEGRFTRSAMRAFDVIWGDVDGDVVVENTYANVSRAVDHARPIADGRVGHVLARVSRGAIGGEEINARVRIERRPVVGSAATRSISRTIRVDGTLSGDFHVYGEYTRPFGFGRMTIDDGVAYGEPFETATAALRFEGNGVRLDGIEMAKGAGAITGAAFVGWNGTYSFNAEGRGFAVETLDADGVPGHAAAHRVARIHRERQRHV